MTNSSSASKRVVPSTKNQDSKVSQYLTFVLAGETFAFGIETVREVVEVPSITRIPHVSDYMRGVINLRGTAVPVMDLRCKFGLSSGEITVNSCIIIVTVGDEDDGEAMGALVDSVCEVVEIPVSRVEAPPRMGTTVNNQFMKGMVEVGDNFFILLDVERVFNQPGLDSVEDSMEEMADEAGETQADEE